MQTVNGKLLKYVNHTISNLSNTSADKMYLSLAAPAGIDILFVTITNFSVLKGGIFSVGGTGSYIWLILEPGTSLGSLILRLWFV